MFVFLFSGCSFGQQRQFPIWNSSTIVLPFLAEKASIIAVGDLENVREYGIQEARNLHTQQDLHTLYWCEADFRLKVLITGALPHKKYLWGSVSPGCRLYYGDQRSYEDRATRLWFMREDGEFLRPVSDGSRAFYGFYAEWPEGSGDPRRKLGNLILTPDANAKSLQEYSDGFWELADFACDLLWKTDCVKEIDALAWLGNVHLRETVCAYLKAEQGEICRLP